MITALLGLLGGLLADAGQQGARRGRLHELSNRLGLGTEEPRGDLRTRVIYAMGQGASLDPQSRIKADALFLELLSWATTLTIPWEYTVIHDGKLWSQVHSDSPFDVVVHIHDVENRRYRALSAGSGSAPDAFSWPLPSPGYHAVVGPLVAWLYRRMAVSVTALSSEMKSRVGSPSQLHEPDSEWVYSARNLSDVGDWFDTVHPDLGPLTWQDACEQSQAWHQQFKETSRYRQAIPNALIVVRFDDGSHIDRLVTNQQFIDEGGAMGHCIGGMLDEDGVPSGNSHYYQESRDGLGGAFSYRDPDGVPQATLYLHLSAGGPILPTWTPDQLQGPDDEAVTDPLAVARLAWFMDRFFVEGGGLHSDVGKLFDAGYGWYWQHTLQDIMDFEAHLISEQFDLQDAKNDLATGGRGSSKYYLQGMLQARKKRWVHELHDFIGDLLYTGEEHGIWWVPVQSLPPGGPPYKPGMGPSLATDKVKMMRSDHGTFTARSYKAGNLVTNYDTPLPVLLVNWRQQTAQPEGQPLLEEWEIQVTWPEEAEGPTWTGVYRAHRLGDEPGELQSWSAESLADLIETWPFRQNRGDILKKRASPVAEAPRTWWPGHDVKLEEDGIGLAQLSTPELLESLGLMVKRGQLVEEQ